MTRKYSNYRPIWWEGYGAPLKPEADIRIRLAWLYGDPDERERQNAPDVALWRGIGGRTA